MEKTYYFVDVCQNDYMEVQQYGKTCDSIEEAREIFKEAVHAHSLDDDWDNESDEVCSDDVYLLIRQLRVTV